ncbi:MAG: c-type cytochrome [Deltaproteobacteria bacterium]|nr:c-type cytochrome [Deltaproteobacteria bacterium]
MSFKRHIFIVLALSLSLLHCKKEKPNPEANVKVQDTSQASNQAGDSKNIGTPFKPIIPLGLDEDLNIPEDNPLTAEKVELGKLLYFDKRLSLDKTVSCASCHNPDPKLGWSDGKAVSDGVQGEKGTRNAPTVINSTYMMEQFWDGRAPTLEEQAKGPLTNPVEMKMPDHGAVVDRIRKIPGYTPLFQKAFGEEANIDNIAKAIASFERTVLGGNSLYDRYQQGEKSALTESQEKGLKLFFGKANCTKCHVGSNFSDSDYHNLGVGMTAKKPDLGRYEITKQEKDKGAFKTPTLRDITKTAPYMHDGSQKTLEEVIEFYNQGGEKNPWLDSKVEVLHLNEEEKKDLVNFLKALDSEPYPFVAPGPLPE